MRLSIPARTSWNALSENEPTGPHRPLEELVPAVALEPGHARWRVRPPPLAEREEPGEQPGEMVALAGAARPG